MKCRGAAANRTPAAKTNARPVGKDESAAPDDEKPRPPRRAALHKPKAGEACGDTRFY